ncbi:MAG: hypothetical protein JSR39_03380 [Verrucomicrobia bacterium]|nr:hypothetical protein [Verrucomicrobiota bacterium]
MSVLTSSTSAPILSPPPGPVQSQPLLITHIVIGGKLYRVEACLDDSNGGSSPFAAQYSQDAMRQIQSYAQDLFAVHELHHNSISQQPLDVIGANSQGVVQRDNTAISHDFLIEPLDRAMAARIAPDVAPIAPSAVKAQDIWNRLSSSILAGQTASSPSLTTPSPISTPTNLTPSDGPLLPGSGDPLTAHANPSTNPLLSEPPADDPFSSTPRPLPQSRLDATTAPLTLPLTPPHSTLTADPLLPPPLDSSSGIRPPDPVTPLRETLDDAAVLTHPDAPIDLPEVDLSLDPSHVEQPNPTQAQPARRAVLSTELQLKDHDFTAENWYEAIPLRTRLRICQNILKAHSTHPVERRVWDRFQQIHQLQASRGGRVQTISQLVQQEAQRLNAQCQRLPSSLTRRQRNQAAHFLRRFAEKAPAEELNQWFSRYRLNDQFFRLFEEQIEAEGLLIAESERPAWVRAHYTEDIPRFARVLERYLDSN